MVKLDSLAGGCMWTSHVGCLKACLDYLGASASSAWVMGATGHAFVLNIHPELCPSGPTAWKSGVLHRLGTNIGCKIDSVFGSRNAPDFASQQRRAYDMVRAAIDQNIPCFGWELNVPEYYVIHGYDDEGYLFRDFHGPEKHKPWRELGDSGIGWVEVSVVRPAPPASDEKLVRDAIRFALDYAKDPAGWTHAEFRAADRGYGAWIEAMEQHKASAFGLAYNAAVWAECRELAGGFLAEAAGRVPVCAAILRDAAAHYSTVGRQLSAVAKLYPFLNTNDEQKQQNLADTRRREQAIAALRSARAEEAAALAILRGVED